MSSGRKENIQHHRELLRNAAGILHSAGVLKSRGVVGAGGFLGATGLKHSGDIDLWVSESAFRNLRKLKSGVSGTAKSGSPVIRFQTPAGEIEAFTGPWMTGGKDFSGKSGAKKLLGMLHWSRQKTMDWKKRMGREKDLRDLDLLKSADCPREMSMLSLGGSSTPEVEMGDFKGKSADVCQGVKQEHPGMSAELRARIANSVAKKVLKISGYPEAEAARSRGKSGNIYPELLTELAAKVAKKHLDTGAPMNELLADEANELTPEQLQTVCQLANRAVHGAKFKEDSFVKFPVAETSGVKNILIARGAKGKAKQLLDSLPEDLPGTAVAKEASVSTSTSYYDGTPAKHLPVPPAPSKVASAAEDLWIALQRLDRETHQFLKEASSPEDYAELVAAADFVDHMHRAPFNLAQLNLSIGKDVPDIERDMEKIASKIPNPYVPIVAAMRKVADLGDAYLEMLPGKEQIQLIQGLVKNAFLTPLFLGWHLWDKGKEGLSEAKEGKMSTLLPPMKPKLVPGFQGDLSAQRTP